MNPAALKTNLKDLQSGGILIVNTDNFGVSDLDKARYKISPLEDSSLKGYRVVRVPVAKLTREAVAEYKLSPKEADRCKNFFALGLVYWLYERPLEVTLKWIREKFAKNPQYVNANTAALKAGYNYGETVELLPVQYQVAKAKIAPGTYRKITGNEAAVLGFVAAAQIAGKTLVYGSYPITPASPILEGLAEMRRFGVKTFQAEDEIAAIGVAIGASYGGAIGITGTSGPGICLKSEAINLAVMTELPLVIVDVQRGGPSTGLPTKTEQSDLLAGDVRPQRRQPGGDRRPAVARRLLRHGVRGRPHRHPVHVPGLLPLGRLPRQRLGAVEDPAGRQAAEDRDPATRPSRTALAGADPATRTARARARPSSCRTSRDEFLARPWAIPGTPGLEHRIGGIEKQDVTGNINYEPANHQHMTDTRAKKIENIAQTIPDLEVTARPTPNCSWSAGAAPTAASRRPCERAQRKGLKVAQAHFRYLNPMPKNTAAVLKRFKKILVPGTERRAALLAACGRNIWPPPRR